MYINKLNNKHKVYKHNKISNDMFKGYVIVYTNNDIVY